jgi:hypothetical protein
VAAWGANTAYQCNVFPITLTNLQGGLTMKRVLWLLALLAVVLLRVAPVQADDGFFVVAGRVSTGIRIASLPLNITAPGHYYLNGNLSSASDAGITVDADNVTIDLMGFCLTGNPDFNGIRILNGRSNVEVRNGTVTGWGMGVEGGSSASSKFRIIGIRAVGNKYGIQLSGNDHLIKGCTASQGFSGAGNGLVIYGSGMISNCTVMGFTPAFGQGIYIWAGTVSDNVVINCNGTNTFGIIAQSPSVISRNSVINCTYGISLSSLAGGSVIGNAVYCNTYDKDLACPTGTVVDQNSFSGVVVNRPPVWGVNGVTPHIN